MSKSESSKKENVLSFTILGEFKSGRSTFIETISDVYYPLFENKQAEEKYLRESEYMIIDGIFLNFGKIIFDEGVIGLVSGFHRTVFERLWQNILPQTCYPIFMDSSAPDTFRTIQRSINNYLKEYYAPSTLMIVANKQDLPDAWSVNDLRIALRVPDDIPIVPCVAHDKKSVANVLITMLEEELKNLD